MVKYITLCEMTTEFLKLKLEERQQYVQSWVRISSDYGMKILFWCVPIVVIEHVVCVFEACGNDAKFFKFQREWLGLGTDDVGRYIRNTRSIPVY